MSYKDKWGITRIRTTITREKLSLSVDEDGTPVLLVVPHIADNKHHHFELTYKGAVAMRDWLNEWLAAREKEDA
jgi:hypothetical protein